MKKIFILLLILAILIGGSIYGGKIYKLIFKPNINLQAEISYLHIPSNYTYEDVIALIKENNLLKDYNGFEIIAKRKNYPNHVKAGRYLITKRMSNNQLINLLRSGVQSPVHLTFNNIRLKTEFASYISKELELDSTDLLQLMNDEVFLDSLGFTPETSLLNFIPNTYEVYWNTNALKFFLKMNKEHKKYWNQERIAKAEKINLSPIEVSILASIVQAETNKRDEMPKVAGLYLNRLRKYWLLQADPTVKFAIGDFGIKRVLYEHLEFDSPYNTYKYGGLPPGPINMPEISSIEAVLNAEQHKYMFMCAKADMSGYHAFAISSEQHARNASAYQRKLNEMNIK